MDNTYGRVAMIATVKKEHMDKVYKIEDVLKKANPGNIYRSENDTTSIYHHILTALIKTLYMTSTGKEKYLV